MSIETHVCGFRSGCSCAALVQLLKVLKKVLYMGRKVVGGAGRGGGGEGFNME